MRARKSIGVCGMALKEKILEVMGGMHVGAVATIAGDVPAVRFMSLEGHDDLMIVGATRKSSRKVEQIKNSPTVAISIWSCRTYTDPFVVIQAKAEVHDDMATKQKYWNEVRAQFFKTVDNPDYVVVMFTPQRIEYYEPAARKMEVWEREKVLAAH
jgi:general stress protein 26